MAYHSNLLFNNVFLASLKPEPEELAAAGYLVHESARDWYVSADFSSAESTVQTWLQPLLAQQSLDLVPCSGNAWYVVAPWNRDTPLALCYVTPKGANLDGYAEDGTLPKGQHWMIQAVNAARRAPETPLRWVILTNGVQWRLLDAQALRRYEAYVEIDLYALLNGEDDALAAYLFYRLFRLEDALEQDDTGRAGLESFLEESTHATEATEAYLKQAVSDNLNTPGGGDGIMAQLCIGIVRDVDPSGTRIFTEDERSAIYRDATYLLYRLLFILYAEARALLPVDRDDYRAVSLRRLIDEAVELRQNPELMAEKPTSLWEQLDTLFNAIHYSDEYLGIPPYNGGLFENKDKPYLGSVAIENVYLAEALYELAFMPGESEDAPVERIDYGDLSVRHLGSLYEGMIEYRLYIAEEELLARRDKDRRVKYLSRAIQSQKPNDEVVKPGSVYFAQSPHERKATGTHYTAEDLVGRLVQQTVGRLLDERWQAFEPKFQTWLQEVEATPGGDLRSQLETRLDSELNVFIREQVLTLRICDPAMGSGHFLVHIAHYVTAYILDVLAATPLANYAVDLNPGIWRLRIVERCLYGIDINEMAAELAKLSLWLATMQLGRPLSFLDHHLKCGDSLLGVGLSEITSTLDSSPFNQVTRETQSTEGYGQLGFQEPTQVQQRLEQARELVRHIEDRQVKGVADIRAQEEDYNRLQNLLHAYRQVGDLLLACRMGMKIGESSLRSLASAIEAETVNMLDDEQRRILGQAEGCLADYRSIHWSLEYPLELLGETERQNGFDVIIGNPPYLGGAKISTEIGSKYLRYIKSTYSQSRQNTDLCAYFLRRGYEHLRVSGCLGLVITNTIGQGDTRESGLGTVLASGGRIIYGDRYVPWPGDATVEVNLLVVEKPSGQDVRPALLDDTAVSFISSWMDDLPESMPCRLAQNQSRSFRGSVIDGAGFLLTTQEAARLESVSSLNGDCLLPYLVGRDINNDPQHRASRKAIYFRDWSLEQAQNYPDLLDIIKERVKPHRDGVKRKQYREKWWLFAEDCVELRRKLPSVSQVLVRSRVSELHMITFVPKGQVFSDATIVFLYDDYYHFSVLQSYIHEVWLRRQASTLRTDVLYTPTNCFQTFPFPQIASVPSREAVEEVGRRYYDYRRQVLQNTRTGLTKTYNRFHDPECQDEDVTAMRCLHSAVDRAVLDSYGWSDIDLEHGFHVSDRRKVRYMPSREAQREIFTRLLALNQEIAAAEAAQGLIGEVSGEDEDADLSDE